MKISGFKIYNASAGSGKTYQLTKNYLELILAPAAKLKYRQLLALTFTNKAVAEMKERILNSLRDFSRPVIPKKNQSLFNELSALLGYTDDELREKARITLKRLLHNYAFFEISTIDKFNHNLIRTFAKDLKLAQGFEVELDIEALLGKAVAKVLNKAGKDEKLTQILVDFALDKIANNKSWNIAYDLNKIGIILFQENHADALSVLQEKTIADFTVLKKRLQKQMAEESIALKAEAEKTLELIENMGFEATDFPRETLPNHFKKIRDGERDPRKLYQNKLEENLKANTILKANVTKSTADIGPMLLRSFRDLKTKVHKIKFYKDTYTNIQSLTLINEISKEVKSIQDEQNVVSISEFNSLIGNEIKNQPVPFIYERLGEKYQHYFIDEFQDTSKKQWSNLIPLIGNAIEAENEKGEAGTLFLVGDVKQAIYRWRGGEAEQFLKLSLQEENPFVVAPAVAQLDKNWRSRSEIIQFNNAFFGFIADRLKHEAYKNLYKLGNKQLHNTKTGGYVEINFLDEEKNTDIHPHCLKTHAIIEEIHAKGYTYDQIVVLVRDNKNALVLAEFLTAQSLPVISGEALLLKTNTEVRFLIHLLGLVEQPTNTAYAFEVLSYLSNKSCLNHDFILDHLTNIEHFLGEHHGFLLKDIAFLTVYDILELAILKFDLCKKSNAYVTYLLDEAFMLQKKDQVSVFDFLAYWERNKDKLAIAQPEEVNAVQIMTIHKSKGLEFPFVIFPFAHTKINDKQKSKDIWVPVESERFNGFTHLLVKSSSSLEYYSQEAKAAYHEESHKSELDDFNVLYVALTRAIHGLFIISDMVKANTSLSYNSLLKEYVEYGKTWPPENDVYKFGTFNENSDSLEVSTTTVPIPFMYTNKQIENFGLSDIANQNKDQLEALHYGNLLHLALAKIYRQEDIAPTVAWLLAKEHIAPDGQQHFTDILTTIVNHETLAQYFAGKDTVYNEVALLDTDGNTFIPDKLICSGNNVVILDYKTGIPESSHKKQLGRYADILSKMGFFVIEKILVYINDKVNLIFV